MRKPSFLLWKDGRGRGFSQTLNLQDINALNSHFSPPRHRLIRLTNILHLTGLIFLNRKAIDEVVFNLKKEINSNFSQFINIGELIDEYYQKMVKFLKSLP